MDIDLFFCKNIYYYLCVDFRDFCLFFIKAKVHINIKVIPTYLDRLNANLEYYFAVSLVIMKLDNL